MSQIETTLIIGKLRKLSQGIPVEVNKVADKSIDIGFAVATVLGTALGLNLPLPSTKQPLPAAYFATTHGDLIRSVLSQINESYLVRTQVAYDAAVKCYVARHNLVHVPPADLSALMNRIDYLYSDELGNDDVHIRTLNWTRTAQTDALDGVIKTVNLAFSQIKQ